MSLRALIVDDHPIIRDALVSSLVALNVFDHVETLESFQELLERLQRDATYRLLILDLSLADISGSQGVVYVREEYPDIPIMVFSASDSPEIIAQCFELGVQGFVSKVTPMQIFVNAIRVVLAGGIYIPPAAAQVLGIAPTNMAEANLEPAEERVHLAEGTVKAHLHSIYQLLRVHNRAQAILRARELQLID